MKETWWRLEMGWERDSSLHSFVLLNSWSMFMYSVVE